MKKLVSLVLALMLVFSFGAAFAEGEKITLQFWHSMSGTNADSIDHMVATYNASQDAVEVVATFQGDYYTSIANAIMAVATGTGPDVIQTGSDQVRMMSDEEGTCANMMDFLANSQIKYEDFVELKSESACRAAGKLGIEGKEYVVQDGDIMHFLFNV